MMVLDCPLCGRPGATQGHGGRPECKQCGNSIAKAYQLRGEDRKAADAAMERAVAQAFDAGWNARATFHRTKGRVGLVDARMVYLNRPSPASPVDDAP